jgi:hypothetical protein
MREPIDMHAQSSAGLVAYLDGVRVEGSVSRASPGEGWVEVLVPATPRNRPVKLYGRVELVDESTGTVVRAESWKAAS